MKLLRLAPVAFALLIFAASPFAGSAHATGFTVSGRQILLNGQPFQARGVCYQPAPVGDNPSAASPYGDYFTAGYASITARDLPLLRQMGANVIRVYAWDPLANHTAFLDACYNNGVNPIYVLINRWIDPSTNWSNATAVNAIKNDYLNIDANLANHPAVLGIILGNEANNAYGNGTNAAFWSAMNTIATAVKAQNPSRLMSVAMTDALTQVYSYNPTMTALDFWCVQVYRGTTFGTFFSTYAAYSGKPLVISEYGIDAFNNAAASAYPDNGAIPGTALAGLWSEIAANAATCAGGCVFEFSDEWWKAAGLATNHDNGGSAGGSTDNFLNEEWFGLFAVSNASAYPNTLAARAAVADLQALWLQAPAITAQPAGQTVTTGGNTTFTAAASGSPAPTLQWQVSTDGGGTWTNLTDIAPYAGTTTGTLVLASVGGAMNGYQYRCVATNSGGPANSSPATLTVTPAAQTITFAGPASQPFSPTPVTLSASADSGLPVAFAVVAGPATVAGSTLTLTGAGAVTVVATQAGNADYAPAASVERTFTVTANFLSWQQGAFTAAELLDPKRSGPSAVYGADGLSNLVKYALGLAPTQNVTAGLPVVSANATDWTFTYQRPTAASDVSCAVEVSTDLVSWTATQSVWIASANGIDTWQARYPRATAANVNFRLAVTR